MEDKTLPLREQCFLHVVCHVMEYSPQELALLPVPHRRALLRTIAPVHLYCLEQTSVASGINTDAIWKDFPRDPRMYMWDPFMKLHSYKAGLGAQYIAYLWHLFLGMFRHPELNSRNNLVKMVFATHTSLLEDATIKFLRSHQQTSFVFVSLRTGYECHYLAPAQCIDISEIEAAAYLIKIGALPKVLTLSLSYVETSVLWQWRIENGILQQVLQKAQLQKMILDFSNGNPSIGKFILQTVSQSAAPVLQSLELLDLHVDTLTNLAPLFSSPEGYSGLKELHAKLFWPLALVDTVYVVQYPLFASIIDHQTALETLDLSQLGDFPDDTQGQRFISALTSLLGQPQFRRLKIWWCDGLPLAALQSITEAFMSSSPQSEQHLTLMSVKVVVLSRWQSLFHSRRYHSKAHLSVSAEHAAAVGPRKQLCFQNTCIPCVFLRWFCGMKHLCLNTLEFINCKTDTPKRTIREHFKRHPNFHVQHFRYE